MYAIKMNNDKTLVTTVQSTIYQGEKNADTLVFLVPKEYESTNISNCTMLLRYILPDNIGKSEELEMDPEPYKNYYQYRLKVNTSFTNVPGDIELWLCALDIHDNLVLKTGTAMIYVTPSKNIVDYFDDDSRDQLERMNAKIALLEKSKADNIIFNEEEDYLQLSAGDEPIGNRVSAEVISGSSGGSDEVIHFGDDEDDTIDGDDVGNIEDDDIIDF